MSTRYITGAVGAVIGFYIGGPQGAYWGWTIGSTLGAVADPGVIRGPSLNDVGQQTSQEGGPRPIVFALSPPMGGNIIVSGKVRKVKRRKSQGKGGPKVETEALLRTYAVGVCEGPITRFVRVWRNAELVYDARAPEDLNIHDGGSFSDIIKYVVRVTTNNQKFVEKARFYTGTYDQNPDPALEELFGVGTTPAHRGTAYIVVEEDDLTDFRGAIPQYMFQVERCEGYFLTSRPYAIEGVEALAVAGLAIDTDHPMGTEAIDVSFELTGGNLGALLHTYTGEPEALDVSADLIDGELRDVLIEYEDGEPEALDVSADLIDGELSEVLVEYDDGAAEALDVSAALISGSLS